MVLPLQLACAVSAVFKRHVACKDLTRLGFLWLLAERAITCASQQVVSANTKATTPAESGSPARPAIKSVVVKPTSPLPSASYVSLLIVKRTAPPEERRRKRHRARCDAPQYTATKRRHHYHSARVHHRADRPSSGSARHVSRRLSVYHPRKRFAFIQLAVITPTQRRSLEEPLSTPPHPLPTATVSRPPAAGREEACGNHTSSSTGGKSTNSWLASW